MSGLQGVWYVKLFCSEHAFIKVEKAKLCHIHVYAITVNFHPSLRAVLSVISWARHPMTGSIGGFCFVLPCFLLPFFSRNITSNTLIMYDTTVTPWLWRHHAYDVTAQQGFFSYPTFLRRTFLWKVVCWRGLVILVECKSTCDIRQLKIHVNWKFHIVIPIRALP